MYMEKLESIGPLTRYVVPGYGRHGVKEGYEETRMGNKMVVHVYIKHIHTLKSKLCIYMDRLDCIRQPTDYICPG